MAREKKAPIKTMNSIPEKRDIMTEMFEHFGIKVIDVSNHYSKSNKRKNE